MWQAGYLESCRARRRVCAKRSRGGTSAPRSGREQRHSRRPERKWASASPASSRALPARQPLAVGRTPPPPPPLRAAHSPLSPRRRSQSALPTGSSPPAATWATRTTTARTGVRRPRGSSGWASPLTSPSPPGRPSPATSLAARRSSLTRPTPSRTSYLVAWLWCLTRLLRLLETRSIRTEVMSSAPDITGTMLHAHHNHGGNGHHHGIDLEHPVLALSMTTLAICVKEGLFWITKKAGEKEGSGLMKANAWHHRADAISSAVALVGVGGSILGLPLLDPLAGLIVSGMILKAGLQTGYESILELVDAAVDPSLLKPIKETILKVDGVKGCHRLRGRKAGTSLYLDVHIEVYPFLSVSAAHDIGETVRHQIQKAHNQVAEVFIHIDPSYSVGPKMDQERIPMNGNRRNSEAIPRQQNAEAIVSDIISSHFSKKMSLEHLMLHYLQGRLLLQVQVSMPQEILIRDAMEIAKQAEEEILRADASISQVSVQLRLGQQIEQLQLASSQNVAHDLRAGAH